MSRGRFLKGVGGAAVAMSVLSGAGPLASIAQAARTPQPYDIVKHVRLSGSQAQTSIERARLSADARVLIGNGLSTDAKVAAAKPIATLITLRNGTIVHGVGFQLPNNRELYKYTSTRRLPKALGVGTSLAKLYVENNGKRVIYSGSEMGKIWRRPSSERTTAATGALGGCPPVAGSGSGGDTYCTTTLECQGFQSWHNCVANGVVGTGVGCSLAIGVGAALIGLTGATLTTPAGIAVAVGGCGQAIYNGSQACCTRWVPVCKPYPQIG